MPDDIPLPATQDQPAETSTPPNDPGERQPGSDVGSNEKVEAQAEAPVSVFDTMTSEGKEPETKAQDADRQPPEPEQVDDQKPPQEQAKDDQPKGEDDQAKETETPTATDADKPQARARIKNLEAENGTFKKAFANIQRHLGAFAPEEAPAVLEHLGKAAAGDTEAKAFIAKRLGITAEPAAAPAPSAIPADLATELVAKLEDYFEPELAAKVKALVAPATKAPATEAPKATEPTAPAPAKEAAQDKAPQPDPAFSSAVTEMRGIYEGITKQFGAQAPALLDAVSKAYTDEVAQHVDLYGEEPPASALPKVMARARDQVLRSIERERRTPRQSIRGRGPGDAPPATKDSLSVYDNLVSG